MLSAHLICKNGSPDFQLGRMDSEGGLVFNRVIVAVAGELSANIVHEHY